MSHYSRLLKVVVDAPPEAHDQELAFWQGALGQDLPRIYSAEYYGAFLRRHDLLLLMQRLEAGTPRVHLDIHTDNLDAEVTRLERLGAERVQKVQAWWVMRDPVGLLFCVLPIHPRLIDRRERPALGMIVTARFGWWSNCVDSERLTRFPVAALGYEFERPEGFRSPRWSATGSRESR